MNNILSFPAALLVAGAILCGGCHGNGGAGASAPDGSAGGGAPVAGGPADAPSGGTVSTANATNDTKFRLMTLVGLAKPVKVIEITDLHFGKPTDPPALLFRYRTDLPVTPAGRDAVHKEALRIWGVFQKMTEQAHYPVAVITACDAPKAGSTHSQHPMTFAWALHNGIWQEIA